MGQSRALRILEFKEGLKKREHFYSAVTSIFLRRIGRIDGPCSTKL